MGSVRRDSAFAETFSGRGAPPRGWVFHGGRVSKRARLCRLTPRPNWPLVLWRRSCRIGVIGRWLGRSAAPPLFTRGGGAVRHVPDCRGGSLGLRPLLTPAQYFRVRCEGPRQAIR
eukprot:2097866-Pyramimonas_sp.AAC.1